MPKTEQVTKYNANVADKEGNVKPELYMSEDSFNKLVAETKATGGDVEATRIQSFTITEAESLDEAASLFPKRALEFLNYGARLAQQNVMRDYMRDAEWAGQEGAYDLLPEVQEPKERTKASPRDKAISIIAKLAKEAGQELDRDAIEKILAQFIPQGEAAPQAA
jgi:hypothetical protein